jgi:MYXO-CTERM domain-containing protein
MTLADVSNFPLFLHVFAAMALFGTVLAAAVLAFAGQRHAAFVALAVSLPEWVLLRGAAAWLESEEHFHGKDPTWINMGHGVADEGLIVLLLALGAAFWWRRSDNPRLARATAGLCSLYLLLLALAWLAMSGKWS